MSASLREVVTLRAEGRCEYCRYPETVSGGVLHLDHILPPDQGGTDNEQNRALSCPNCNLTKGLQTEAIDPQTGQKVPLFNPRHDPWSNHFLLDRQTGRIECLTSIGRGTAQALGFNRPARVAVRLRLLNANLF